MTFKTFFNTLPHYIPNAIFRIEMFFSPKKRKALEIFIKDMEYSMYRYGVLDNCTCKKIMDKDDKYIESITELDNKCLSHGDVWSDDDEDDDCCNMCDDMDAVEAEDRAVDQQNNFIRGK